MTSNCLEMASQPDFPDLRPLTVASLRYLQTGQNCHVAFMEVLMLTDQFI